MKKYLIISLLVLAVFALCWAENLFFLNWKVESAVPTNYGYIQYTLSNPDPNGQIKKVVVAYTDKVIAYWFFDELSNPQLYELKKGKYVSNPEKTQTCISCHTEKKKTPTS